MSANALAFELLSHGAIGRIDGAGVTVNLFPGNEVEGGPANLWLRCEQGGPMQATPLLGPLSPLAAVPNSHAWQAGGDWLGLRIDLQLRVAAQAGAWFWHVQVENRSGMEVAIDLTLVQDIALAPYASIRLNEHYVSHYVDLTPLVHPEHGPVLAARQNLAVAGRHPWALMGSLRKAVSYATDALQVQGLGVRAGALPQGIAQGLPAARLQHEHALIALQDERVALAPGTVTRFGFFGRLQADHAAATSSADLAQVESSLALAEAQADFPCCAPLPLAPTPQARSLFASAPLLTSLDLDASEVDALFGAARRHEEFDGGALLSFFYGEQSHVVLRAKELRTQRPHGHILRTGRHLVPDESALTSTVWMGGVFHSMLTQGHVSINRFLSTVRGWLGHFRSQGQRLFVHTAGAWQQLGLPSAFEIQPEACRWIYKFDGGSIEVHSRAEHGPHAMTLQVRVLAGAPLRLRITQQIALGGDDGRSSLLPTWRDDASGIFVAPPAGSELALRFPGGGFRIEPLPGTCFERVGGDECLYEDGHSRGQAFVCIDSAAVAEFGLRISGHLLQAHTPPAAVAALPAITLPSSGTHTPAAQRLVEILPWYRHNALVHYLAPRGLEQYSGGGWGTRDVCQGPLEMLLALGHTEPVRDLLCRVFAAQNGDGDWPQWFMFFERDARVRAGDSHGDIVFWPLLGLAQYLLASEDQALLEQALPFYAPAGERAESATLWQHAERALAVIAGRRIPGTQLAAYGHGDWNDSLQPADPALRERLCSAWTVTLHHQTLTTLARALKRLGRSTQADELQAQASAVQTDFQRLLVIDGLVTGYALFPPGQPAQMLLHPSDRLTGVRHSLLPMMHAILDDMLSPAQAQAHFAAIERHLKGPDGARLFDRPMAYRGGPETLFQRAESSAFFGREIGVMYMHAHLRYAQMLAHLGQAQPLFEALAQAHPIALREAVPSAGLRQANCYYSSSDAAFADRYEAQQHYARIGTGEAALEGGWRIYSSGPGIAIAIVVGSFLGLRREKSALVIDPVMPRALDGLCAQVDIGGAAVQVIYRLGAAGCGVTALQLNGAELDFERRGNPYRVGAAAVSMLALRAGFRAGMNRLVVCAG